MKRRISSFTLVAVLMLALVLVPMFAMTASAAEESATLTFDNTSKRTEFSTAKQVWTENGITFTNDKASSSTNVADYSNPVRLYASSSVTIACSLGNITKIVFTANSSSYATALGNSIGSEATVSGSAVTVTPTASAQTYTINSLTAQVRLNSLTVTYEAGSVCAHANTTTTTVDATCTTAGSTTVTCTDCGETVSTEEAAALGHLPDEGVVTTPATKGEAGVMTYTCQREGCGNTYTEAIPALGWTSTFVVPDGEAPVVADALTVTMPAAPALTGDYKYAYTFAGWAKAEIDGETTDKPELYEEGDEVALTADTTFYAVYMRSEGGSVGGGYVQTDISSINATDVVIIVWTKSDGSSYAFTNANGTSSAPAADAVTVNGTALTGELADNIKWNIANDNGNLTIYPNGTTETWLYCTATNNGVRVGTNADKTFIIDADSGYLKHTGTGRFLGVYNTQDVRCYTSFTTANIANQTVAFYVLESGGTAYYTTALEADTGCTHENTTTTTVAPTCTEAGYVKVDCADCGVEQSYETVAATGHSYDDGVVTTDPTCTEAGVKTFTCGVCDHSYTEAVEATGHDYNDDLVCNECGDKLTDYSGRYYIAAIRSSGNYFYMTGDLGTASTKRYQAIDSGLTVLPLEITSPEDGYVFVLVRNADGTYSIYAEGVEGDNYLGWTSGNSGALVAEADALKLTVDENEDGTLNIHFTASDGERYLALNGSTGTNYFAWYKSGQRQDLSLVPVGEPETPAIVGAQVNVGADLAIKYHVSIPEVYEASDFILRITNAHGTVVELTAEEALVNGNYIFIYSGIAPQCMSDSIKAELIHAEEILATVADYSVVKNAKNLAADETATAELKQLLADLLAYGMAAQAHLGDGHTVSAVTDEDIAAIGVEAKTEAPTEDILATDRVLGDPTSPDNAYISGAGVRFDNEVQIYVTVKGADATSARLKVGETYYDVETSGSRIYLPGMSMTEVSSPITVELYYGDETVHTVTYGAYAYIYQMIAKDADATVAKLAQALYNCAESAKAYVNA